MTGTEVRAAAAATSLCSRF